MELKDIKKVLILGAGTMGQQIGLTALQTLCQGIESRAVTLARPEEIAGEMGADSKQSRAGQNQSGRQSNSDYDGSPHCCMPPAC